MRVWDGIFEYKVFGTEYKEDNQRVTFVLLGEVLATCLGGPVKNGRDGIGYGYGYGCGAVLYTMYILYTIWYIILYTVWYTIHYTAWSSVHIVHIVHRYTS